MDYSLFPGVNLKCGSGRAVRSPAGEVLLSQWHREPTERERDINNEPNIISIEKVSMWGWFTSKIIPHHHQLLQHDRVVLLRSVAQHGAQHKSLRLRMKLAFFFKEYCMVT